MNKPRVYYLGLGSNLQPETNIVRALYLLQAQFGRLRVWPVVRTDPVELDTQYDFLNTLVLLQSHLEPRQMKIQLNAIESELGRDRNDPERAFKDRPIDIDILACQHRADPMIMQRFNEPYIQSVLNPRSTCLKLNFANQNLGHAPATVDTDHAGRHIVVIEDSVDRFFDSSETTLPGK